MQGRLYKGECCEMTFAEVERILARSHSTGESLDAYARRIASPSAVLPSPRAAALVWLVHQRGRQE
jgi:hypothetical protein